MKCFGEAVLCPLRSALVTPPVRRPAGMSKARRHIIAGTCHVARAVTWHITCHDVISRPPHCRLSVKHWLYKVGQKNRTVFRLDNFVTVSPRKACSMSKFSTFYREKRYKTRISVSLSIFCQICSNRRNSWNYGTYDQNTWIILNLH